MSRSPVVNGDPANGSFEFQLPEFQWPLKLSRPTEVRCGAPIMVVARRAQQGRSQRIARRNGLPYDDQTAVLTLELSCVEKAFPICNQPVV